MPSKFWENRHINKDLTVRKRREFLDDFFTCLLENSETSDHCVKFYIEDIILLMKHDLDATCTEINSGFEQSFLTTVP